MRDRGLVTKDGVDGIARSGAIVEVLAPDVDALLTSRVPSLLGAEAVDDVDVSSA